MLFPGALGDFVCFLPALHALIEQYSVDLLARSEFAAIAPAGVRVESLERFEVRQLFSDDGAREPEVRQFFASYDAVYSWFAHQQPAFVAALQNASQGRAQVFPFRPVSRNLHQADYYLACLKRAPLRQSKPSVALDSDAQIWSAAFCHSNGIGDEPLLLVAPGSGAREKNWLAAHYLQIIHWWRDQCSGKVIVVVGPVELERGGFESFSASAVLARGLDLAQLAALLARSDLYLGNDSGVSHLAAAVGARTVALFGPSDERQWAPRGPRVAILRRQTACSPCNDSAMKLCPGRPCLAELTPGDVIQQLRKLPEIVNLTRLGVGIKV